MVLVISVGSLWSGRIHLVCFARVRLKTVLIAQAEAEKIKKIGEAEASSIEAVGKAEAEKMRLKAEAYQQYGEAAKTALVLEALPKVAQEPPQLGLSSGPVPELHPEQACAGFTHTRDSLQGNAVKLPLMGRQMHSRILLFGLELRC